MVNRRASAETSEREYARAVGARLRQVRQRHRLSLQAVERLSAQEFKASVVGAYERGERVISVSRLQRLAVLYEVAVDSLLPEPAGTGGLGRSDELDEALAARIEALAAREPEILERYLRMIRARRRAAEGASIAIRAEDVQAMELLMGGTARPG